MAQIVNAEIMDELRALAAPLAAAALGRAEEITSNDPSIGHNADTYAMAMNANAYAAANSALLQSFPLTQAGVVIALATVAGTVLGQCDGDRSKLWEMFKHQTSSVLAEITAARMPAQGNA
jgi:hypothetical protein